MGDYIDNTEVQSELDSIQATLGSGDAPTTAMIDKDITAAEGRIHGVLAEMGYSSLPLTDAADVARLEQIALDLVVAAAGRRMLSAGTDPDSNDVLLGREEVGTAKLKAIRKAEEPLATTPDQLVGLGPFSNFTQTTEGAFTAKVTHDRKF